MNRASKLLLCLPPHVAHALATFALTLANEWEVHWPTAPFRPLGSVPIHAMGLEFAHPVGLAGGFDKNAHAPFALAALGFAFVELGTVTAQAQDENSRPNLFRLPLDRALINRLGFPNEGAQRVAERYQLMTRDRAVGVPVGFSIGKSRAIAVDDMAQVIADYRMSLRAVAPVADFVVVNVSSPNTSDLRKLQDRERARALLSALRDELSSVSPSTPMLVKIAPDMSFASLDVVLDAAAEFSLGLVATNTTISREGLRTERPAVDALGQGGLSGPTLLARAVSFVRHARDKLGPDATIIGVGGIATAHDVHQFLKAGANLVQLYTSLIYEGPGLPRRLAGAL